MYDIIIVGGGPAGLTAALYARRANKNVLVIEKNIFGGQITFSPKVENIPGFAALSGNEFAEKMVDQVMDQGADFESAEVLKITETGDYLTVVTDMENYEGKTAIIATGARHRLLGVENEEKFIGDGISFCAVCDGAFYKGKTVAVVGGGNSALQEAILVSDLVEKVYIVQDLDFLTGEQKLREQVSDRDNIEVMTGCRVLSILGEDSFEGIKILRTADGAEESLRLDGMFVAIGLVPQNEAFAGLIDLDERGYAMSDESCLTKRERIFTAGDCRTKSIRQVTTAASDGAIAALAACRFLDA